MTDVPSKELAASIVNDMSRFLIVELPGPVTTAERQRIAERVAAALTPERAQAWNSIIVELRAVDNRPDFAQIYLRHLCLRAADEIASLQHRLSVAYNLKYELNEELNALRAANKRAAPPPGDGQG